MKAKFLLMGLGLLAGCTNSQEQAETAIHEYYSTTIFLPPRSYEPLLIREIMPAAGAQALPGERWFYHCYVATDFVGHRGTKVDTIALERDGRVVFYSSN